MLNTRVVVMAPSLQSIMMMEGNDARHHPLNWSSFVATENVVTVGKIFPAIEELSDPQVCKKVFETMVE